DGDGVNGRMTRQQGDRVETGTNSDTDDASTGLHGVGAATQGQGLATGRGITGQVDGLGTGATGVDGDRTGTPHSRNSDAVGTIVRGVNGGAQRAGREDALFQLQRVGARQAGSV